MVNDCVKAASTRGLSCDAQWFFSMQGAVFSAKFCVDSPYTLAVGGQKNGFHLLNVARLPAGKSSFVKCFILYHIW